MADFAATLKDILTQGIGVVNKTASNVARATRYKMSEMDSISRRREAISELGEKVYGLYQAGVELPEEIVPLVNEIHALDEGLDALRTDRAAAKAAAAVEAAAAKAARAQARAEAKAAAKAAKEAAAQAAAMADVEDETPTIDFEQETDEPLTYTGTMPTMEPVDEEEETEDAEPTVM